VSPPAATRAPIADVPDGSGPYSFDGPVLIAALVVGFIIIWVVFASTSSATKTGAFESAEYFDEETKRYQAMSRCGGGTRRKLHQSRAHKRRT
jgi:hypothetical protein